MTDTVVDNRSVLKEWATAFPELGKYSTSYLLRICGPVAVGIRLFKVFPTTYRPEAVLLNLADSAYPKNNVVHQFLRGNNRVQMEVSFDRHYFLFTPATQAMREQAPIVVAPIYPLTDMIEWILRFLNEDYVRGTNPLDQCKAVMMLSRLLRDDQKGAEYFEAATKRVQKVPKDILDAVTGGFDRWFEQVERTGPGQLTENVHGNIERLKMAKLPSCGALPDMW